MTVDEVIAAANQSQHSVPKRGVILLALGGFAAVSLLSRRRKPLRINGLLAHLIIFFLLWAALSVAWADDSVMGLKRVGDFALLAIGALAVAERFSIRQVMLLAFVSCGLFLGVGVFAEIALGTFRVFQSGYRFCGTDDPNVGSWGLGTLLLTAVALASAADRHRGIFWATAFVPLTFLLLSRTRTSVAAVILAFGSYWVLILSRPWKRVVIVGLISIVCLCLAYLVLGDALISDAWHVILLGREGTDASTMTGRTLIWNECLSYVAKRPLLGYGYDCFWTLQRVVKMSSAVSTNIAAGEAYNGYIDLVLSVGVVGAGAYVLVLGLAIKRSIFLFKTSRNSDYAFVCSLLIFHCVVGLTGPSLVSIGPPNMAQFMMLAFLAQLGFGNSPTSRLKR